MTRPGLGDSSPERLLPKVGEGVIDALHQDLVEMASSDKTLEDFITEGCANIQDENLGVAIVLRNIVDSFADDEDLTPGAKMLFSANVVYKLLRNQAEADQMNQLPVDTEEA